MPHTDLPAPRWRLLRTPPLDGASNMALDLALMRRAARTGEWVMRVYAWSSPTLSLGRNQTARGCYDLEAVVRRGLGVVRRPTGGRAILHDHEVTYSVTGPAAAAGTLGDAYERINRLLLAGLRSLGVDCMPAGDAGRSAAPTVAPCFEHPAPGELVHAGRKLVGSAQWRDGGALLQHGSILLDGDQSLVAALLADPVPSPPPPATLAAALGRVPSACEVAEALEDAVRTLEDDDARPLGSDPELDADMAELRPGFMDDVWTWRR
jgi:lipoyl(octanoyl) transferase